MEPILLAYLILGCTMLVALLIVILKIAGKEMYFAFRRFLQARGSDVFIVDPSNNHVNQYYRIAKEEHFIIENEIYLTNPYKLQGLNQEIKDKVSIAMEKEKAMVGDLIKEAETKREIIEKQIKSIPEQPENVILIQQLQQQYNDLTRVINETKSKLNKKQLSFFRLRRPVYFYLKGDPVPKDFVNLYTEMDCIQLENIISRAQTKDPKSLNKVEKDVAMIKKLMFVALIGIAIAIWLSFHADSVAQEIARAQGVVLSI